MTLLWGLLWLIIWSPRLCVPSSLIHNLTCMLSWCIIRSGSPHVGHKRHNMHSDWSYMCDVEVHSPGLTACWLSSCRLSLWPSSQQSQAGPTLTGLVSKGQKFGVRDGWTDGRQQSFNISFSAVLSLLVRDTNSGKSLIMFSSLKVGTFC